MVVFFAVSLGGSIVAQHVCVAPFWSELQSPMSKIVTPQQSEHVCPPGTSPGTSRDKIQHYRSIVDRYKISEREGVHKLFYTKLNN
jgi:hypothetical protein